jgi:sigma-B regulation protein RsbU (phosphoserine phosphatase)
VLVGDFARLLARERATTELMVMHQAAEVERLLAAPTPHEAARMYTPADFTDRKDPPPGIEQSAAHSRLNDAGEMVPTWVSYDVPVIRLAADADPAIVHADAKRLGSMGEVYRRLNDAAGRRILWQYTSLDTGLHCAYPGKGGYPHDYEPRDRDWYVQTRQSGAVRWYASIADVITGRSLLTCAAPVRRPNGDFAGVTAVDLALDEVLAGTRLSATWDAEAELMIVGLLDAGEAAARGIETFGAEQVPVVIAEGRVRPHGNDWRRSVEYRPLDVDTPVSLAVLAEDMAAGDTGVRHVTREGRRLVLAFNAMSLDADRPLSLMTAVDEAAIIGHAAEVEAAVFGAIWSMVRASLLVAAGFLLLILLIAWRGSLVVSRPVTQLADVARRIAAGDLEARVPVKRSADELEAMSEAFNAMVPQMRDRMRIRESLHVAMEVQQSLLPDVPPQLAGLDVAGRSIYCDETGGDYYDFIDFELIGPRCLGIAVGDVVGHGVAAALLMATGRALLRSRAAQRGSVAEIMTDVNRQLCSARFTGRFMTMFCLILDVERRALRWVSAGHDPAIVYDPGTDTFSELEGADLPLGLQPDWTFTECASDQWPAGRIILLGTDGIWECFNDDDEKFGKQRLKDVIRDAAPGSAQDVSNAIHDALRAFRGGRAQLDDITMVVIKVAKA